jgi:hydroxymethylglutaryl-CoA reductase (NADPH)
MRLHELKTSAERRAVVEKESGAKLDAISRNSLPEDTRIENMVGATQVPLGIAGPVRVNGRDVLLPLATTEGALVASVSRGCRAITESGGCTAIVLKDAMTRAPVFRLPSAKEAVAFTAWVGSHFQEIKAAAEEGSSHLRLQAIRPWIVGRNAFLRFEATTGDAMGMNMLTIGCGKAVDYITAQTGADCVALSGNMCADKKPSALGLIEGRGKSVVVEAVLSAKTIKDVLKTTPERIVDVAYRKNLIGSALAGSHGFNAHAANIVAAMFIALGQDPAHVAEASQCFSLFEREGDGVHASVTMPDLPVGSVGGGTRLPTQREALAVLGAKTAREVAECVAAGVLAGEISLAGALSAGQLAKAHKELGR